MVEFCDNLVRSYMKHYKTNSFSDPYKYSLRCSHFSPIKANKKPQKRIQMAETTRNERENRRIEVNVRIRVDGFTLLAFLVDGSTIGVDDEVANVLLILLFALRVLVRFGLLVASVATAAVLVTTLAALVLGVRAFEQLRGDGVAVAASFVAFVLRLIVLDALHTHELLLSL